MYHIMAWPSCARPVGAVPAIWITVVVLTSVVINSQHRETHFDQAQAGAHFLRSIDQLEHDEGILRSRPLACMNVERGDTSAASNILHCVHIHVSIIYYRMHPPLVRPPPARSC